MFQNLKARAAIVAAPAVAFASGAQAAAIDVTSVVSEITSQAAPIALIGGAVLAVYVGIKAFKWVRRAL